MKQQIGVDKSTPYNHPRRERIYAFRPSRTTPIVIARALCARGNPFPYPLRTRSHKKAGSTIASCFFIYQYNSNLSSCCLKRMSFRPSRRRVEKSVLLQGYLRISRLRFTPLEMTEENRNSPLNRNLNDYGHFAFCRKFSRICTCAASGSRQVIAQA